VGRRGSGAGLRLILLVVVVLWLVGKTRAASQGLFTSASLDEARIAELARASGFPESTIAKAVDVARCESGFRARALGDGHLVDLTWGPSIGVWQIRSRHADFGTGRPRDASRLIDPAFNARAAYAISAGGTDWSAWTCR
jgi:lysozyme-like protein